MQLKPANLRFPEGAANVLRSGELRTPMRRALWQVPQREPMIGSQLLDGKLRNVDNGQSEADHVDFGVVTAHQGLS
jgi:hypothetical protein